MRKRGPLRLFPKVIRAGAGPHDLGPGDNAGDTSPELTVQPDTEPADDADLEPDIVIRNTPYVWFLMCPFLRSEFCLQDREYDSWGAVADYVFQVIPFPMSLPGCSTSLMAELRRYIRIATPSGSDRNLHGMLHER